MYSGQAAKAIWRGVRRRCPRCGGGGVFRTRFRLKDECPTCAYHFRGGDEEAFFLGAMTFNFAFTEGVLGVLLLVSFAVTLPDPPLVRLVAVFAPLMVVTPILFYPAATTLWAAVDFMLRGGER